MSDEIFEMGNTPPKKRYIISHEQLLRIKSQIVNLLILKGEEHLNKQPIKIINYVIENQLIGESMNELEDDINDIRNLFTSWIIKGD